MKKMIIALSLLSITSAQASQERPTKRCKIAPEPASAASANPWENKPCFIRYEDKSTQAVPTDVEKLFEIEPWTPTDPEFYQETIITHDATFTPETFNHLVAFCREEPLNGLVELSKLTPVTFKSLVDAAEELSLNNSRSHLTYLVAEVYRRKDKALISSVQKSYQDEILQKAQKLVRTLSKLAN